MFYILYFYILYLLLFIFIIIVALCAYIKIQFRFWSEQPVFHVYDFRYYLFPPGIINFELPEKNRWTNFKNIETIKYSDNVDLKLKQFTQFIRQHYLQNGENQFNPTKENIGAYFSGHNSSSFFSYYYDDEILIDSKTSEQILNKKMIGAMTSRPIRISINKTKDAFFSAYYVDYLCVDKSKRKQNIAPQLIQTHHYNQRLLNKNIVVSLFKREGEVTGIVPLCIYKTYCFDMTPWAKPPALLPYVALVEVGKTNIHHLLEFFKENNERKFDICIMTEIGNIMELIKTHNIFVYMIITRGGEVLCAYFFRDSCVSLKKGTDCLCCFASINCCKNDGLFAHGYKVALWKIHERMTRFKYAVIENISDNDIIVNNLLKKSRPIIVNPAAYFFYNFAYHTFNPKKVLVIN